MSCISNFGRGNLNNNWGDEESEMPNCGRGNLTHNHEVDQEVRGCGDDASDVQDCGDEKVVGS